MRYSRYGSTIKQKARQQNSVQWEDDYDKQEVGLLSDKDDVKRADVVVVMKPAVNGKAKCYTTANSTSDSQDNHVDNAEILENNRVNSNHVETRI